MGVRRRRGVVIGTTTALLPVAFLFTRTAQGFAPAIRTAAPRPFVSSSSRTAPPLVLLCASKHSNRNKDDSASKFFSSVVDDTLEQLLPWEDLSANAASLLGPLAKRLNTLTNGWALTYADLTPETEFTLGGQTFLATNIAYGLAGLLLVQQGDGWYGLVTEAAGIVSFIYHYTQLKLGPNQAAVRLALLVDYCFAGVALVTTTFYLATGSLDQLPIEAWVAGAASVIFLSLSWVWEVGYPYLFWHSLWHMTSAYAGYLIGQTHLAATTATTAIVQ